MITSLKYIRGMEYSEIRRKNFDLLSSKIDPTTNDTIYSYKRAQETTCKAVY